MQIKELDYWDSADRLRAHVAIPANFSGKAPAVMVAHAWEGRNDFVCQKAKELAELGYIGIAIDVYGDARLGVDREENAQLMAPFMEDRSKLRQRLLAAFNMVKAMVEVDAQKIAAIGYCFGGLCVLDLARSGADLKGVVSFHGLLRAPQDLKNEKITAKVLALHGHDDPMVPPSEVAAFQSEMTEAKVDWQTHIFGLTKHAFTNPDANDHDFGTVYSAPIAKRAWLTMQNFLNEIFV